MALEKSYSNLYPNLHDCDNVVKGGPVKVQILPNQCLLCPTPKLFLCIDQYCGIIETLIKVQIRNILLKVAS